MSVSVYVCARDVRVALAAARVEAIARATLAFGARPRRHALDHLPEQRRHRAPQCEAFGHRGATDVISFGFRGAGRRPILVGDIYIAPAVARANALGLGVPVREELARLVVHGTLHVLGYEHPEADARTKSPMWKRQERLLARALASA